MPLFQQKRKTKHSVEGFYLSPEHRSAGFLPPHVLCRVWDFWQSLCLSAECVCFLMVM